MAWIADLAPNYILISPGPKDPAHAGISMDLIRLWYTKVPILGVCLGMQCLNEVFKGATVRSSRPMHGKTSRVVHTNKGIFKGIPSPFQAARYHSLIVKPDSQMIGKELMITATTQDDIIMGLSHRYHPLQLIENFLRLGPLDFDTRVPVEE